MNPTSRRFKAVDLIYILLVVLPILFGIVFKILTKPISPGIAIEGAYVYFTIPMPIQDLLITESQINSALVILSTLGICLYLTHGMKYGCVCKRHHLTEWAIEKVNGMVIGNMGEYFAGFSPFVVAILVLSGLSSFITLVGLYPPTSDVNIVGGWAILVFILITYYKMKCGPVQYIKSFAEPVALMPLNLISEVATPISMAFRHYGNVLSGSVISVLVATGLQGLTSVIFGALPGFLGEFPFLQIGLPAILSLYFDLFSGGLQAYIFAMLTMLYVSGGFPIELYMKRKEKRLKKQKHSNA